MRSALVRFGGAITAAAGLLFAPSGPPAAAPARPWVLAESEEFAGGVLQPRAWEVYNGYNPLSGETWRADHCSVSHGVLELRADRSGLCGIAARTQHVYARIEVRARFPVPADPGLAPVFLLWPQDDRDWPQAGEIDFMECYDPARQSFESWLHYARAGRDASDTAGRYRVDMTGWHTYAVEWTRDAVAVSVDGRTWHTYRRHVPAGPMHLTLQIDRVGRVAGAANAEVDWVRTYRQ
ncbi:glycoside hydrolase family 16 protein [Amycolatopsis alkalitolerans]|uniref:Glycoside hydrolase family 16 protein n=1 Tax=Amycolatopsis alkalitolerans TaxID=2547244 RepID=A0A5C4M443_9PSEU|nr:glycoside hydrolase family 16 protein [Amycolatopsis alkalitolerans]TNC27833.1 glycoside hydrolase family 16 protein [Amycolatopsis alkalitolerans]